MQEGELIKLQRTRKGLSLRALSKIVNLSPSTLSRIERGETFADWEILMNLCNVLDIDKKEMAQVSINSRFKSNYILKPSKGSSHIAINEHIKHTIEAMQNMNDDGKEQIANYAELLDGSGKYIADKEEPLNLSDYTTQTYTIGSLAAGDGFEYGDSIENYRLVLSENIPEHDFTLDVTGDSMMPLILDGDIAFIIENYDKINNEIYAVDVDGMTYIKRAIFETDQLILRSINEDYEDIIVTEKNDIRILGLVVGWTTPIE